MTGRRTINDLTSDDLDQLYNERDGVSRMYYTAMGDLGHALNRLDHICQLHQPTGVAAAAEAGNPPDCTTCGPNRWPCPTYNAITKPGPAATEATEQEKTTRVFAALHRSAEQDVTRVIALYEQWVKAGPPPLGVLLSRWWDARLVELHDAILPPDDQTKEQ